MVYAACVPLIFTMWSVRMQTEDRVAALLAQMTLAEKLGQLQQFTGDSPEHRDWVRRGMVGSIINVTSSRSKSPAAEANALQEIAVKETRLGIPMIFGRDVIHGYRTVMPIPLGQAATFDMELVEEGAAIAAREASAYGVHWTFAPMVDVSRDPRWGRIAESGGEDPLLNARLGAAMVRGFQGEDMSAPDRVAACAKHYVGYGAAEGGRDYNTTYIPEGLLRDVYLPPFKACVDAGVATFMSAFKTSTACPPPATPSPCGRCSRASGISTASWSATGTPSSSSSSTASARISAKQPSPG